MGDDALPGLDYEVPVFNIEPRCCDDQELWGEKAPEWNEPFVEVWMWCAGCKRDVLVARLREVEVKPRG